MARFLVASMPFVSHMNPSRPIVRALVDRGHEVVWLAGQKFTPQVAATGAHHLALPAELDFDEDQLDTVFPGRVGLKGIAQFKWNIKHIFLDAAPAELRALQVALGNFPADALLSETTFAGAQLLREQGGPPWAVLNFLPLLVPSRDTAPFGLGLAPSSTPLGRLRNRGLYVVADRLIFGDVTTHFNRVRATVGLGPTAAVTGNPDLFLQGTTQGFEYPRSDLPANVRFIGPLLPEPPATFAPPAWWPDVLAARRIVLVTQGTVATTPTDLLVPAIQGLAAEDVLVIVTTGRADAALPLAALPANVRVAPFLSYHHLLPHVAAMVSNGGYGSVQLALAHGIPLIVAGGSEEKPEIAARVAWAGVGINLHTQHPTSEQIRAAVRRVLDEPGFRAAAGRIRDEFARADAPSQAAALLETLAASR